MRNLRNPVTNSGQTNFSELCKTKVNKVKIYLVGYMASGKSRLGKELAEKTGYVFYDLDDIFEERYRISILDFFDKYGELNFRRIEKELLLETIKLENTVISTGGGTPCYNQNMDFILKNGISIYIRQDIPSLLERLKNIRRKRPLLKDVPSNKLEAFIIEQVLEREQFYMKADFIISGPGITIEKIMEKLPGI
jgi:shikimate kinase